MMARPALSFFQYCAALPVICGMLLALMGSVSAHNKSLSFSEWQWSGQTVNLVFTVPQRDVTLLPLVGRGASLTDALSLHLNRAIELRQLDSKCKLTEQYRRAVAREGYLRLQAQFTCYSPEAPIKVTQNAFFNLATSHVHFARFRLDEQKTGGEEVLFTTGQRVYELTRSAEGAQARGYAGNVLASYIWLGMGHILVGIDHLAFLLCLLIIARSTRQAVFLVTGFTAGHSLTLMLAALGLANPDAVFVESMIGLSIAIMAAEPILARRGWLPALGLLAVPLLFFLALPTIIGNGRIAPGGWAGLMLFIMCYGLIVKTPQDSQRLAPVLTFAFGLFHGFGFAGQLSDIGLPVGQKLIALFGFNLGVELGQLLVLVPALLFGRYVIAELPKLKITWSDIGAALLTGFGMFLFAQRAFF
ncbi:MAG: HupE/UreJ family protein [Parvibaculales bacterium]